MVTFDRTEHVSATAVRPEVYRHIFDVLASRDTVIARGAGLSYSAASFDKEAVSIDLTRFDRILGFDTRTGNVSVEPGLRIGALMTFLASKARHIPAVPGYPAITVGGCVAFDVHGKSQFHSGNFGDWVEEITLHHRDHGRLVCNRYANREVFELSLGGFGLTGIITALVLRTLPLPGTAVEIHCVHVETLQEAAEVMRARASEVACLYSWNDLNRRGKQFGVGVVYLERFVDASPPSKGPRATIGANARLPLNAWNRTTTRLALRAYRWMQPVGSSRIVTLHEAMFPIQGKEFYYAAFGGVGFREYQLIVPFHCWDAFAGALETVLARYPLPVTLGSLKLFKGTRKLVRFCDSGICLALDVPAQPCALALFEELDALAITYGATVNLSKDSRLGAPVCERIFPEYAKFRDELTRFDPKRRHSSRLRILTGV